MSQMFGDKLRKIRNSKRMTLEELACGIGTSKAYVWQLENKMNAKPSADLLIRISNFLGESPEYFVDDNFSERSVNHVEEAFFRKFKRLSDSDKLFIDKMVSGLDNAKEN